MTNELARYHIICEHCGVWLDDHDYEHLARECYPKQIKALEDKVQAPEITRLRGVLEAINRLASPGNRSCDEIVRDMDLVCDLARANMTAHLENRRDQ